MAKYRVFIHTGAYASVDVEVEDDLIEPDEIIERAETLALENAPTICGQCSGWGQNGISLDLGDDWEVDEDPHGHSMIEPV